MDDRHPTRRRWHSGPSSIGLLMCLNLQVIKSRIQSAATGTYSGFLDCVKKTIAIDGVGALWRGIGPAMARAFPANAAAFVSLNDVIYDPFRI